MRINEASAEALSNLDGSCKVKERDEEIMTNFKFLYDTFHRPGNNMLYSADTQIVGISPDGSITKFEHDETSKVLDEELAILSAKTAPSKFLAHVAHLISVYEKTATNSLKYVLCFYRV